MNKYFIVAAVLLGAIGAVLLYRGYEQPKVALIKEQASAARSVAVATQATRKEEHKVAAKDNAASTEYQKGLEDGKTQLQAANDDLRAKLDRLRKSASANRMSSVSASDGRCNAPGLAALPEGYRDAVIEAIGNFGFEQQRLASEADDQAKQLTAAQKELLARSNASDVK